MLLKSIGIVNIDKKAIHKNFTSQTGIYDGQHDLLNRKVLTNTNFTESNCYCFRFDDKITRPLVDMEALWIITKADRSGPNQIVTRLILPGCFTPPHVDWMQSYSKKISKNDQLRKRRWWIPVDDYITGQVMMGKDYTLAHYKSGEVFPLHFNGLHCGVNASTFPRYYIAFTALSGNH